MWWNPYFFQEGQLRGLNFGGDCKTLPILWRFYLHVIWIVRVSSLNRIFTRKGKSMIDWEKVVRFLCLFSFKLGTFNRHANISTTDFICTYNYAMHSCSSRRGSTDFWKGGWKGFFKKGEGWGEKLGTKMYVDLLYN